jgi:hypothetical protein
MYLEERTTRRREQLLQAGVVRFYANNLMLFQRKAADRQGTEARISCF